MQMHILEALESRSLLSASAGLKFNISYSPQLKTYPHLAAVKTAVNYVANEYSTLFSTNITLNIRISGDAAPHTLGYSVSNFVYDKRYSEVRKALIGTAAGATDQSVDASNLPAKFTAMNPFGDSTFELTRANAKALGLLAPNSRVLDGTFTFGTHERFGFDPLNRAGGGEGAYDFVGTAEHEFSEIMGRQSELDTSDGEFQPFDLFRYRSPGVRSLNGATNNEGTSVRAYFSTDGGKTKFISFSDYTGDDISDWRGQNHDAFDAEGQPNDAEPITPVDVMAIDAIGYTLAAPP